MDEKKSLLLGLFNEIKSDEENGEENFKKCLIDFCENVSEDGFFEKEVSGGSISSDLNFKAAIDALNYYSLEGVIQKLRDEKSVSYSLYKKINKPVIIKEWTTKEEEKTILRLLNNGNDVHVIGDLGKKLGEFIINKINEQVGVVRDNSTVDFFSKLSKSVREKILLLREGIQSYLLRDQYVAVFIEEGNDERKREILKTFFTEFSINFIDSVINDLQLKINEDKVTPDQLMKTITKEIGQVKETNEHFFKVIKDKYQDFMDYGTNILLSEKEAIVKESYKISQILFNILNNKDVYFDFPTFLQIVENFILYIRSRIRFVISQLAIKYIFLLKNPNVKGKEDFILPYKPESEVKDAVAVINYWIFNGLTTRIMEKLNESLRSIFEPFKENLEKLELDKLVRNCTTENKENFKKTVSILSNTLIPRIRVYTVSFVDGKYVMDFECPSSINNKEIYKFIATIENASINITENSRNIYVKDEKKDDDKTKNLVDIYKELKIKISPFQNDSDNIIYLQYLNQMNKKNIDNLPRCGFLDACSIISDQNDLIRLKKLIEFTEKEISGKPTLNVPQNVLMPINGRVDVKKILIDLRPPIENKIFVKKQNPKTFKDVEISLIHIFNCANGGNAVDNYITEIKRQDLQSSNDYEPQARLDNINSNLLKYDVLIDIMLEIFKIQNSHTFGCDMFIDKKVKYMKDKLKTSDFYKKLEKVLNNNLDLSDELLVNHLEELGINRKVLPVFKIAMSNRSMSEENEYKVLNELIKKCRDEIDILNLTDGFADPRANKFVNNPPDRVSDFLSLIWVRTGDPRIYEISRRTQDVLNCNDGQAFPNDEFLNRNNWNNVFKNGNNQVRNWDVAAGVPPPPPVNSIRNLFGRTFYGYRNIENVGNAQIDNYSFREATIYPATNAKCISVMNLTNESSQDVRNNLSAKINSRSRIFYLLNEYQSGDIPENDYQSDANERRPELVNRIRALNVNETETFIRKLTKELEKLDKEYDEECFSDRKIYSEMLAHRIWNCIDRKFRVNNLEPIINGILEAKRLFEEQMNEVENCNSVIQIISFSKIFRSMIDFETKCAIKVFNGCYGEVKEAIKNFAPDMNRDLQIMLSLIIVNGIEKCLKCYNKVLGDVKNEILPLINSLKSLEKIMIDNDSNYSYILDNENITDLIDKVGSIDKLFFERRLSPLLDDCERRDNDFKIQRFIRDPGFIDEKDGKAKKIYEYKDDNSIIKEVFEKRTRITGESILLDKAIAKFLLTLSTKVF